MVLLWLLWFFHIFGSFPSSCTGNGLVCIQYSSNESCECCVIFCPVQRQRENAHLACKSQPSIDALLPFYWVAVLYVLHILSVDYVTPWEKPPVAPKWSPGGTFQSSEMQCLLLDVHCLWSPDGGKKHSFLSFYLFFLFRNWPLVAGVQSEECCGFLAVNIWPRTERTSCRSKVRELTFCLRRYFRTSFDISAVTHELLCYSWRVLSNVSSKNEIPYECHEVCYN